ncbi:MAG: glycosyltransferase family 9 protein [Nevskiales bacterium]
MTPPPATGKYAGYWTIKKLRRGLRNRLSAWLARGQAAPLQPLDPAAIRRVIDCRRNHRLGNMLFLTPLLRSLAATLPQAEIDLLVGNASYAGLFQGLPGVRRVWAMPRRGWLWPLRMLALLFRLRRQDYDLVIEPSQNSFSNRLSARLCGARWRLGFYAPDQWLSLTHTVIPDPDQKHEVLKPLQLISRGFADAARLHPRMALALTAEEQAVGRARWAAVLDPWGHGPVIGFFTEATGKKRLPPEWWQAWLAGLRQSGQDFRLLQILPPGTAPAIEPGMAHVREPDHRRLAALLGNLDLFVSCDAGPMHLAAAAGVSTLGLFHTTRSERYRPLGEHSLALEVKDQTPTQAAGAVLAHLARLRR